MPHSLFLGSALATQDRVHHLPDPTMEVQLQTIDSSVSAASGDTLPSKKKLGLVEYIRAGAKRHFRIVNITDATRPDLASHAEHTNRPYSFVRLHLYHGIVDMVISLLGLAVVINSMCVHLTCESIRAHLLTACSHTGSSFCRARCSSMGTPAIRIPRASSMRTISWETSSENVRAPAYFCALSTGVSHAAPLVYSRRYHIRARPARVRPELVHHRHPRRPDRVRRLHPLEALCTSPPIATILAVKHAR